MCKLHGVGLNVTACYLNLILNAVKYIRSLVRAAGMYFVFFCPFYFVDMNSKPGRFSGSIRTSNRSTS